MGLDRIYYKVKAGSPVMKVINQAQERRATFTTALRHLKAEFKAKDVIVLGGYKFYGLVFDGELPPGWRKDGNYAVPDRKTKEGKQLALRFKAVPTGIDSPEFTYMLSRELKTNFRAMATSHGKNYVMWTSYEKFGDIYVLGIPMEAEAVLNLPKGLTELKMSQYWKLREAAEVKSKGEV